MNIFMQLQNNKGTVSSALGKKLAEQVLSGDNEILKEAIDLVIYNEHDIKSKNIRSGGSKNCRNSCRKKTKFSSPFFRKIISSS